MRGGFLWDDYTFLKDNWLIQAPDGLQRFWFTTQAEDYFPLTSSMLWVEWRIWGDHAAGYHVTNVLLHAARRGAGVAGAAPARRSRSVAGGSSLRGSPGRGGVGGVDHGTEEHAADGALSPVAAGLSALRRAGRAARVLPLDPVVPARAAGEDLGRHAAGRAADVRLVAAGKDRAERPRPQPALLRPGAGAGAGDGLVPAAQRHPARRSSGPRDGASRVAATGWIVWFYLFKALVPVGLCAAYPRWDVSRRALSRTCRWR